jgi:hypothetical protein
MKTTRSTIYLVLALLSLTLLMIWLILPVLAKGIQGAVDNSTGPEKLDLRPIPVPVPAPPVAANQPSTSVTPAPSLLAMGPMPQPIPVPTPLVSATQTALPLVDSQKPETSTSVTIQIVNRQDIIAMTLVSIVLLSLVWLHRVPSLHSLTKENPC